MNDNSSINASQISPEDKQKAFFERARKGVLAHLNEKGGKLSLSEMHDYSLNKFFIQHQSFSRMMETFVEEGLLEFDNGTYTATITDAGRKFIEN